jgi:hypothetical protein
MRTALYKLVSLSSISDKSSACSVACVSTICSNSNASNFFNLKPNFSQEINKNKNTALENTNIVGSPNCLGDNFSIGFCT